MAKKEDFNPSDRIRRAKHQSNYTLILNATLRDERLSWKARGLHHYILSLPDTWEINIAHLAKQSDRDGVDVVKSALKELESCGYISKKRVRGEDGKFVRTEWTVYEEPQVEEPQVENPQVENPPLRITNKEITNKETPLTPQGESCIVADQIPFSDWEPDCIESLPFAEEIHKPSTLAKISSEMQISPAARKKAKLEARAKQFEPLRIVYNQNKPDAWCRCDSLNEARCDALQRLVDEWGDRTIEKLILACQYGSVSAWHRDKNWTIDNLTRKGVVTEMAEKATHSLPKQSIKDRTYAEEYQRIFEALESRRLARSNP